MAEKVQALDGFDKQDQADRVAQMLVRGEVLFLVYDCKGRGTGFIGVTDKRIIARDDGRRGREKQITSIPFSRIHSVSVESDKGWVRGSSFLAISAGDDDWTFNFRGADKAQRAYQRIMESLLGTERAPAAGVAEVPVEG